ncbi:MULTISPECIES: lipocalin-like domain-containing protein [Paraburkholderia]|uniref:lipocalin-like domain-containing protein n=1 Tax=Paraburkholderia TaxID=1822464 RepID=UPI001B1F7643|nr:MULTISPECIES: lipocalin-like domain-containing protein [Paraburkholderia]MCX4142523.1 lipocalin-like domain-containing protein [Paraburkholderia aspalathi]MCX4154677.1 lipocalin-like domain-containing protein [Paraburkholderia aspalathi]MDN7164089.1 lipocalin-like domain-containing protein [Paraburkholderia sp. SECH2]MDN7175200.1 lipocalin-like domain-containing protein [Paraburkholderia sp. SEWSISQ10-3 4]MDQ6392574.1 lipocalin-like domain-containing protein [Paraburkholderia aspalathi]
MKPMPKVFAAIVVAFAVLCAPMRSVFAQTADSLVGSWSLVSLTVAKSGNEVELLGPHPQGQLIFGNDGRYVLLVLSSDLPKFTSGERQQGTAEENAKIARGSVAHFGTYTVDPAARIIVFHIQKSSFPNWDADVQRRPFTLDGDRLTYITPGAFGYGSSKVVWQRIK